MATRASIPEKKASVTELESLAISKTQRRRFYRGLLNRLKHYAYSFKTLSMWPGRKLFNPPSSQPKEIITRRRCQAWKMLLIHFIPLSVSCLLTAMNLKGFYIGAELSGKRDSVSQSFYLLCLQITAKCLELAAVASLTLVVLDVLRFFLFEDKDGLPFGLAGAQIRFTDPTFMVTSTFWLGLRGLKSWRKRIFVGIVLLSATLIAVFIGPSSALLLIPVTRPDWPAGGTLFWLSGNQSELWPLKLDSGSVGGNSCLDPLEEQIYGDILEMSGCIWYETAMIEEHVKDSHFSVTEDNITITDGMAMRELQRRGDGGGFIVGSMAHVARMSQAIGSMWVNALTWAAHDLSLFDSRKNYFNRERGGSVATVESLIPAVRTHLEVTSPVDFSNASLFKFPIPPLYGPDPSSWYLILPQLLPNASEVASLWFEKPSRPVRTTNGTTTNTWPSAFLTIQIPFANDSTSGTVLTCSIDARWAQDHNIARNIGSYQDAFLQHGRPNSNAVKLIQTLVMPVADGTWHQVELDLSWLNVLTPPLSRAGSKLNRWNTLSALFHNAGFDNSTALVHDFHDIREAAEEAVSLLVAEGMSRVGLAQNSGTSIVGQIGTNSTVGIHIPWISSASAAVFDTLTSDRGSAIRPPDVPPGQLIESMSTQLHWSVTIGGYSYVADQDGYVLAVVVVLAYALVVAIHIACVLCRGWVFSEAWSRLEDVVALAYNSLPPLPPHGDILGDGDGSGRSKYALPVKIRARKVGEDEVRVEKQVDLIIGRGKERIGVGEVYR